MWLKTRLGHLLLELWGPGVPHVSVWQAGRFHVHHSWG